jgi:hypothetical protein
MKDGGMPIDQVTRIDETFQALMDDTVRVTTIAAR